MTGFQIYVGGAAFIKQLRIDFKDASESIFVQAMTFEMDQAGAALTTAFNHSPALDQRLLVDSYSKVVINDHLMVSPWRWFRPKELLDEFLKTTAFMAKAPDTIQKQYTNPLGILGWRYPNRNHKKMVVIDRGIAYIGGINFSDHNFKWPDMMIRLTDPDMVTALREDFLSTWNGKNQSKKLDCQRGALYFLDGAHSFNLVKDLIKQIESATGSIDVVSPYLGHPFIAPLLNASKKGVKVRILLPLKNNKIWVNESLMGAFSRHSVQILFLPEMIHLKAILLDKSVLVTGSFNFDIVSCCFEQEVVLSTRDPVLVESFRRDILRPFLKKSVSYDPQKTRDRHYNRAIYAIITVLSVLILFLCRGISIVRRYPIPRSNRVRHR